MVTFRRILVCSAATLAIWGMSHQTRARESGENEASERNGSHDEGSEHVSHDEGAEHNGASSSNSSSESSNSTSSSANNDRGGTGSSRDDSSRGASTTTTARTTTTATRNASTTATTSSRTSAASRSGSGSGTERKARLRSLVGGRGSAEYKTSGTNRSFEVELESASLSPGQTLSVCVNDVSVGAMTVMLSGRRTKAKLKLETRRGHAVPAIAAGAIVTIKLSTATVASGTF